MLGGERARGAGLALTPQHRPGRAAREDPVDDLHRRAEDVVGRDLAGHRLDLEARGRRCEHDAVTLRVMGLDQPPGLPVQAPCDVVLEEPLRRSPSTPPRCGPRQAPSAIFRNFSKSSPVAIPRAWPSSVFASSTGPISRMADPVAVEGRRREAVDERAVVVEERGDLRAGRSRCDRVEQLVKRRHRAPPPVAPRRSARCGRAAHGRRSAPPAMPRRPAASPAISSRLAASCRAVANSSRETESAPWMRPWSSSWRPWSRHSLRRTALRRRAAPRRARRAATRRRTARR